VHEKRHERSASTSAAAILNNRGASKPEYKAVSLNISVRPCEAARAIREKAYLAGDEPSLPLENCDRVCRCNFASQEDRRAKDDRRYPDHHVIKVNNKVDVSNRRAGRDRRRIGRFEYKGIY